MKYAYTDASGAEINISMTAWEIQKIKVWLKDSEQDEYSRTRMIEFLNDCLARSKSAHTVQAESITEYLENNDA